MHKAFADHLKPGMVLAKTLYTERGEVLLRRGAALTPTYIAALVKRGYQAVYIMDGIADDIEPTELVSAQLRATAVGNVQSLYALVRHATRSVRDQAASEGAHVLREVPVPMDSQVEHEIQAMYQLAEAILDEVMEADTLAGMASLKNHDAYTFEHSVEVAVYGVILGKRLGFDRAHLRDLALGCLLHDIGKLYVDARILNKPGKLDATEFEQIMQHTVLGFQLVRQLPLATPRPPHIVLQHHERQDGEGYPNRLFGTNKVFRTDQERFDRGRISLMAEVAAVADVYSALSSDRPYRAALPPEEVLAILKQESGGHLNREIVRSFVLFAQHFPVGTAVRIDGGPYSGYVGLVSRVFASAPSRPMVRLLFDAYGRSLGEGFELNLWQQPDTVELHSLPETGQSLEELARRSALARAS